MPPTTFSAAIVPSGATKYVSGKPVRPKRPSVEPLPSKTTGYVRPCRRTKRSAVAAEVLRVDAEHDEPAVRGALPGLLQDRRLVLARQAPRREEVDHERLAAVVGERDRAVAGQAVEREGRHRLADLGGLLPALQHLPAEQPEHRGDDPDRDDLPDELRASGRSRPQLGTMKTGVPTSTRWKSHSASGISMRMQPCEAE